MVQRRAVSYKSVLADLFYRHYYIIPYALRRRLNYGKCCAKSTSSFVRSSILPSALFSLAGVGLGFDGDGGDGAGAGTDANDGAAAASGQRGEMSYCAGNGRSRRGWGVVRFCCPMTFLAASTSAPVAMLGL